MKFLSYFTVQQNFPEEDNTVEKVVTVTTCIINVVATGDDCIVVNTTYSSFSKNFDLASANGPYLKKGSYNSFLFSVVCNKDGPGTNIHT